MSRSVALNLNLHPKQGEAFQTPATEVLYGGAAGSGKSRLIRVAAIYWCSAIAGLQVYLFRRIRDDLIKNHLEGPKGFRALLADWTAAGFVTIVEDELRFWNGSKVYLCHCKDHRDVYKYQGAEIHVLLIDELTHFTEEMYRFLRSRTRMVGLSDKVPEEIRGRFPRILCGANPGNVGHLFVKSSFIDGALPLEVRKMPEDEGSMLRQYIPARLDDNPSMTADDPGYEAKLSGLGSAELVKAMREGDWNVVEGAVLRLLEQLPSRAPPVHDPPALDALPLDGLGLGLALLGRLVGGGKRGPHRRDDRRQACDRAARGAGALPRVVRSQEGRQRPHGAERRRQDEQRGHRRRHQGARDASHLRREQW
jgi:hypothetical protein